MHALPRRRPLGFRVRFIFRRANQESQGRSGWSEAARPISAGDIQPRQVPPKRLPAPPRVFSQRLRGATCLPPLPRETLFPPQAITRGLPHPLPIPHHELPSKKGCAAARSRVCYCVCYAKDALYHISARKSVELRGSAYDHRDSTFQLTFSALNIRVFPVSTTRVIAVSVNEKCIFVSVGLNTNFIARFTSQVHLD